MWRPKNKGFTLIEFLTVMAISAILIFVAVPGLYSLMQNNKAVALTNRLSAAINLARSEAIKRGSRVSVCPSGNSANSACGAATQWGDGWIVFVDENSNDAIDSTNDLVNVNEAFPQGTVVTANRNLITFDASGFLVNGVFTLTITATGCTGNNGRVITISSSGRVTISYTSCS